MRRCVISLGDRFGLGLYDDGQEKPLVRGSLQTVDPDAPWYVAPEVTEAAQAAQVSRLQGATNVRSAGAVE